MSALVLRAEQVRDQTNAAIEGLYQALRAQKTITEKE